MIELNSELKNAEFSESMKGVERLAWQKSLRDKHNAYNKAQIELDEAIQEKLHQIHEQEEMRNAWTLGETTKRGNVTV